MVPSAVREVTEGSATTVTFVTGLEVAWLQSTPVAVTSTLYQVEVVNAGVVKEFELAPADVHGPVADVPDCH
jgi:hypothetical protein